GEHLGAHRQAFGARVAEQGNRRAVDIDAASGGVGDDNRVGAALEEPAQAQLGRFGLGAGGLRLDAGGLGPRPQLLPLAFDALEVVEVGADARPLEDRAGGVADRVRTAEDPAVRAVGGAEAVFALGRLPGAAGREPVPVGPIGVVGVQV